MPELDTRENQRVTLESDEFKRRKNEDLLRLEKEIQNRDKLEESFKKGAF